MASLDYKGIPEFIKNRELFLSEQEHDNTFIFAEDQADVRTNEDILFDQLTKVYLKGEVLKGAIANMAPASFVPVEDEAKVRASLNRLYPGQGDSVITFGMFIEACDFIASQGANIDENFLIQYNVVDKKLANSKVNEKHKKIKANGDDWISGFLDSLIPLAGVLIASKLADLTFVISPQVDVDSEGGSGSFKSWGAQGMGVAIALFVELGMSLAEFARQYGPSTHMPEEVKNEFSRLSKNNAERERVLTEAGFDYKAFKENQKFNDHKAVKDYALAYISNNLDNLNYAHWVSIAQVIDRQYMIRGAASMAPVFSQKWRKYYKVSGDEFTAITTSGFTVETQEGESIDKALQLNSIVKSYLSYLSFASNDNYNRTYQMLSFQVDPRLVCCLVWLFGPIDVGAIRKIADLLRIASLSLLANSTNLLYFVLNHLVHRICNILIHYISVVITRLFSEVLRRLGAILSDIDIGLKACYGLDVIIKMIYLGLYELLNQVGGLIREVQTMLHNMDLAADKHINVTVNFKIMQTFSGFMNALASSINNAQDLCLKEGDKDKKDKGFSSIDDIGDATVKFTTEILPSLFPIIEMPENYKRRYFSDIKPFKSDKFNVEILGTDGSGSLIYPEGDAPECGENNGFIVNTEIGKSLAAALRGL